MDPDFELREPKSLLRAAQIGASHFLPIFYRPAETEYG
jgi:hypothetical protein